MNERILPSPALQMFFVSREVCNSPLISEMMQLGHEVIKLGLTDAETGIISIDYGKRILINAKNIDIKNITNHDVVEIVDYDPLKNIMMVIGPKDPHGESPVHWIIQKARYDINVLLQIKSKPLFEKFQNRFPMTQNEPSPSSLERAKEILKALRNGKTVLIKNEGILFAGINTKEIQETLRRLERE